MKRGPANSLLSAGRPKYVYCFQDHLNSAQHFGMPSKHVRKSPAEQRQSDVLRATDILNGGGLILLPTDTVWSIGADGTDPVSAERLCNLRGSRSTLSFEILVDSFEMLYTWCDNLHPRLETLLMYHVRPLAMLCKSKGKLPSRLLREDGCLAIRMVRDPFGKALLRHFGKPLLTAFAAAYDQPFPKDFGKISSKIIQGVDFVVRHSRSRPPGEPAVMVAVSNKDDLVFLRE